MPFELREDLDESVLEATATYEDCQVCASTPKALLVLIPDQGCGRRPPGKAWVPLAAIDHESEVPFSSSRGYLIVKRWFADKYGWTD
jgi:hypothetical protein